MSRLHPISGWDHPARRADVVFVHGLGGDAFATWRHGKDESASWPHWLGQEFPEVGVWSLGYAASPTRWAGLLRIFGRGSRDTGHSMPLPDRALQVLDLMTQKGLGERPLFFICHSLGGLLVKSVLRRSLDAPEARKNWIAQQTRAVLFLATPHTGAILATLLSSFRTLFGATVSLEDLRAHDAHLRDLYDWYRNHAPTLGLQTQTYYEQRSVHGILPIVNPSSAHPGVGADPVGLDEDHLSIAKPRERDAQVCDAARSLLREHVLVSAAGAPLAVREPLSEPPRGSQAPEIVVRLDASSLDPREPSRIPREIPPAADRFFGRKAERRSLLVRLRAGRNTAVVGPAGIGKTALAAEALEEVVGANASELAVSPFPDGIVYLDLYSFHGLAEPTWNALANRLAGISFLERRPAHERAAEACRARRALIVLEGGEEADGAGGRPSLAQVLTVLSPENRWLLLTRLSTQATPAESIPLRDVLPSPEAAELLDWLTRERRLEAAVRDAVLELAAGHPLALSWAGGLLAREEEDPEELVRDWESQGLPSLRDPTQSGHTLRWVFERSTRNLDDNARLTLVAAGLLAHEPFPTEAIAAALGGDDPTAADKGAARESLKDLTRRGILRHTGKGQWQLTHVLAYRIARNEEATDSALRKRLGAWIHKGLLEALKLGLDGERASPLGRWLGHAGALLRADPDRSLWVPLVEALLYNVADRLEELGHLGFVSRCLAAVEAWLDRLPEEEAKQTFWVHQRCVLIVDQGDVLRAQGELAGALAAFREALAVSKRLAEADPSDADWQRNLSVSQERIGNVLRDQGDLAGALAAFREALAERRRLAEADLSNAGWQRDLSLSLNKVGDVLRDQGDLAGALAAFREALAVRRRLAEANLSNAGWQRDLSVSLIKVGDVLRDQGDLAGALAAFKEALAVRRRLAEADLSNAGWQRDFSVSLIKVGDVLRDQGDLAGALAAFKEALAVSKRLAEADPSNADWQRDLSVSQERIGNVLRDQGDLAGALAAFREALAVRRRLAEADPSNAGWQRDFSVSLDKVGVVLRDQGNLAGALAAFSEALAVSKRLAEADPSNAGWQSDLSVSQERIGDVLRDQGDLVGALAAFREALAVSKRLAEADPSNAGWQRNLSWILKTLAGLSEREGSRAAGLPLAKESLEIDERLAALDPTHVTWQTDVGVSRALVARLGGSRS